MERVGDKRIRGVEAEDEERILMHSGNQKVKPEIAPLMELYSIWGIMGDGDRSMSN
jgi:hypothetical protein